MDARGMKNLTVFHSSYLLNHIGVWQEFSRSERYYSYVTADDEVGADFLTEIGLEVYLRVQGGEGTLMPILGHPVGWLSSFPGG